MDETELEALRKAEKVRRNIPVELSKFVKASAKSADALGLDWRMGALCAESDLPSDYWFPVTKSDMKAAKEAQKVCWECPVRLACLEHACLVPENYGIFGGITANQREKTNNKFDVLSKTDNPFE